MRCPDWLNEDGKKFWKSHVKDLPEGSDLDGFSILCSVYGHWRNTNPDTDAKAAIRYIALTKQLLSLGKHYGLFPDKTKTAPPKPKTAKGEFDDL